MSTIWQIGSLTVRIFLDWLKDRINGDNAELTGAGGHNHTGAGSGSQLAAASVVNNAFTSNHFQNNIPQSKIGTSAVNVNNMLYNLNVEKSTSVAANLDFNFEFPGSLPDPDLYFYPRLKVSAGSMDARICVGYTGGIYVPLVRIAPTGGTGYASTRSIKA